MREGTGGVGGGAATARVELIIQCTSPEEAASVWAAVSADDPGSVEGRVEADRIRVEAGPASLSSLRMTLDDLLACIQAARGSARAHGGGGG